VLGGCSRFRRCCYLISVLFFHRSWSWAQDLVAVHLDSAVELSLCGSNSLATRASLFGYCAMARIPLRYTHTDCTQLTANFRAPRAAHRSFLGIFSSSLRKLQSPSPQIHWVAPKKRPQKCNALRRPSWILRIPGSPSLMTPFSGRSLRRFLRPGFNPRKRVTGLATLQKTVCVSMVEHIRQRDSCVSPTPFTCIDARTLRVHVPWPFFFRHLLVRIPDASFSDSSVFDNGSRTSRTR